MHFLGGRGSDWLWPVLTLVLGGTLVGCGAEGLDESGGSEAGRRTPGDSASPEGPSHEDPSYGVPILDGGYAGTGGASSDGGIYTEPPGPGEVEAVPTNPFVITAHEPRSTFAADVDTASYDIFRRDVEAGFLPTPNTVRLEEFVNFFDYEYPAPAADAEQPFSIHLDASPSLASSGTRLLRVGIQGKVPPPTEPKPANLVYLVDVSGSMGGVFSLVQHTLVQSLEVLQPTDTVSIVTYAGSTRVALEPTPVSESATIIDVIDGLMAGGSTNGAGGLHLAYEQATTGFIEGGINHVVLCTDGDFNVGISDTEELVGLIEEKRKTGITLTALGYGQLRHNDAMMERVSNAGNGVYGVIGSTAQADEYVAERLLSSLHLIAKDMKLQVEFNPEHVYAHRLLGYENRILDHEEFRDDLIDAGEVGAGHRVTALYELVPVGDELPMGENVPAALDGDPYDGSWEVDPGDLVLVKVRYKDVDATEEDPAYEVAQSLAPGAIAEEPAEADQDLRWASAVAAFAEILKKSPYAEADQLDGIAAIVTDQAERDDHRAKFAELFGLARALLEAP